MKLPISVIILTYNEENNIRDCLESVCSRMEQIIVVDSGSTDKTCQIVRQYTHNIYTHPFENFAQQRNWAQKNSHIKNEWLIHLDADERISETLATELRHCFDSTVDVDGFMMPRKTVFMGRWIKHGGHYPVYHTRLYKKQKGMSEYRLYDQNYIVNGIVAQLKGDIINIIDSDLETWKFKHKKWACLEAEEVLFNDDRLLNMSFKGNPIEKRNWIRYKIYYKMPLFIRVAIYFLYRFIFRLGFLDGIEGCIFHYWHGFWYRLQVDREIYKQRYSR